MSKNICKIHKIEHEYYGKPCDAWYECPKCHELGQDEEVEWRKLQQQQKLPFIVNLCPHDVVIYDDNNNIISTFKATGQTLRLKEETGKNLPSLGGSIPIVAPSKYIGLDGNYPTGNVILLVSQLVGEYIQDNLTSIDVKGVYSPDTGPNDVVRNDNGQIIRTKRLKKYI